MVDWITGTTSPVIAHASDTWRKDASNYWTISGTGDDLGASPIAVAKIDGTWNASDTALVTIDGWTTSRDAYIKVYSTDTARHDGTWSYDKYRNSAGMNNYEQFVRTSGLQMTYLYSDQHGGFVVYSDNLFQNIDSSSAKVISAVTTDAPSGAATIDTYTIFINNTIYNDLNPTGYSRLIVLSGRTKNHVYFYNTDCINKDDGSNNGGDVNCFYYSHTNTDVHYWNTIAYVPDGADINNGSASGDYNVTTGDGLPGNNTATNTSPAFAEIDNNDFHLSSSDTVARDQGIDLSDNQFLAYTADIDGDTRPFNGTWDIGADEYALYTIYRSVGPGSTGALLCATSTNNLNISGSTATFDGGTLDKIGVGDAIVYNASSSIAFISGRNNSNFSYSVQNATGVTPDTVTDDTGWCIFRAYTSLANAESGTTNTNIPVSFDTWSDGRDLVSNKEQWNIACYADASDGTTVDIEGWTTGISNHLRIFTPNSSSEVGTSQRHNGVWSANGYRLEVDGDTLDVYDDYVWIDGLQIDTAPNSSGTNRMGILLSNNETGGAKISNNIIRSSNYGGSANYGIYVGGNTSGAVTYIYNNILVSHKTYGMYINDYGDREIITNNTVYNCNVGFSVNSGPGQPEAYNNIAASCDSVCYENLSTLSGNNISSDDTAPGSNSIVNATVKFFDELNGDYHLSPDDTAALDAGTSSVSDIVTTDIDGDPIHTYDIGADDGSQYFVSSIKYQGVDAEFGTLATWEDANDVDLTATTTLVFDIDTTTGYIPFGASVYGTSSFAEASVTVVATTSNQILLYNIASSTFQDGEWVCVDGAPANCVRLSDAGNPAIAVARIDGAWAGADTSAVDIDGWTTGKYNYIKIYTTVTARHQGKWDDNKYRIMKSNTTIITSEEEFVQIDGLQVGFIADTGSGNYFAIWGTADGSGEFSISNNIVRGVENTGGGYQIGIVPAYISGQTISRVWNNIIYDCTGPNAEGIEQDDTDSTTYFYNNTVYNCNIGIFYHNGGSFIAKNNIAYNNTANYGSTPGSESAYNMTSQTPSSAIAWGVAADNGTTDSAAAGKLIQSGQDFLTTVKTGMVIKNTSDNTYTYVTAVDSDIQLSVNDDIMLSGKVYVIYTNMYGLPDFVDIANNDPHLAQFDTVAKNKGINLYSDPYLALNTDIDGTARGGATDIGADEVPVEFVSTICETPGSGGDCGNMDYSHLGGTGNWEDKVESDLTAAATRVFSGTGTGELDEDDTVELYWGGATDSGIDATVVATTVAGQILVDGVTGTTSPVVAHSSDTWRKDASNYWTISGTGDDLGASPIAIAKIDGTWNATDTVYLRINGWGADYDNYVKIYTTDMARHNGAADYDAYRIWYDYSDAQNYVSISISNAGNYYIEGLQIYPSDNSISLSGGINLANGCTVYVYNNLFFGGPKSNGQRGMFSIYDLSAKESNIYNNIISGLTLCILGGDYVYNNTLYDCSDTGILSGATIAINNIVASTTDPFDGTFTDGTTNNSTDAADSPGIGTNYQNQTFSFVDAANGDFHLTKDDTGAKDKGVDLSSTSTLSFSDDIDGDARPAFNAWDIGADEYALYTIYRSVGPGSTGALLCATSTNNLNISGSSATFDGGTLDNIGVGDAIVYNASSSIAFISGRSSNFAYSVQDAAGVTPDAVTDDTGWCIFRAYTSLQNAVDDALGGTENTGIPAAVRDFDTWTGGQDLVANKEQWNVACYADAADTVGSGGVDINGWTTSETNYIKVYTPVSASEVGVSQRHSGKWDTNGYRLEATGYPNHLDIYDDYVKIDGLQVSMTPTNSNPYRVIYIRQDSVKVWISNSIIKGIGDASYSVNYGVFANDAYDGTVYFWNNIIYDVGAGIIADTGSSFYAYNNTFYNCDYGLSSEWKAGVGGSVLAINNIVQNCTDGFDSSFNTASDYNISDIAGDQPASGAHDKMETDVIFFDELNKDFHISPDDTAALDAGTSSVSDIVTTDIDGAPIHTYDIGADDGSQYFVSSIKYQGFDAEFGTLATWEDANDVDLTATTTLVFDIDATTGYIPFGSSLYGTTSFAVASTTLVATSSNQILLYNIASSTFQSGEWVCLEGAPANCVRLANAGNPAIAVAKIDGAWAGADTSAVTINGWTTGKYNYIKVYTTDTARHQGKWDDNKYRLVNNGIIFNESNAIEFDGIQFYRTGTTGGGGTILFNYLSSANITFSNNIVKRDSYYDCLKVFGKSTSVYKIYNNILYDCGGSGIVLDSGVGGGGYIYNNTVSDCGNGFYFINANLFTMKNNISYNNIDNYSGSYSNLTASHNLSGPTQSNAPGSSPVNNATVTFLDSANQDFRLMPEDTAARDAGTNLSADVNLHFTDDAQGNERYDAKWDIGALEGPTIIYRSVGNDTSNLAGAGNTVTITKVSGGNATTTAVFANELPDNVGVGDVLQYGGSGYYQLAFITARASSTQYEVQARDGTLPDATTSAPVSIFRAHEFLDDWEDQLEVDVNDGIDGSVDELVLYPKASLDLTASNTAMFVPCYASTSPDNLAVNIDGWTTATTSYIKIYTPKDTNEVGISQRHNGLSGSGYVLKNSYDQQILINDSNVKLVGIESDCSDSTTGSYCVHIWANTGQSNTNLTIDSCLLDNRRNDTTLGSGIRLNNAGTSSTFYLTNNIIMTDNQIGIYLRFDEGGSNASIYIYNNTISSSTTGISSYPDAYVVVKNNVIFNTSDDFSSSFDILDHNASDDLDGDNPIDISPGASEADGWAAAFVDYANGDFRIKSIYSPLYDAGTPITLITDDIVGTARPQNNAYDVGAFEFTGAPKFKIKGGTIKMQGHLEFK